MRNTISPSAYNQIDSPSEWCKFITEVFGRGDNEIDIKGFDAQGIIKHLSLQEWSNDIASFTKQTLAKSLRDSKEQQYPLYGFPFKFQSLTSDCLNLSVYDRGTPQNIHDHIKSFNKKLLQILIEKDIKMLKMIDRGNTKVLNYSLNDQMDDNDILMDFITTTTSIINEIESLYINGQGHIKPIKYVVLFNFEIHVRWKENSVFPTKRTLESNTESNIKSNLIVYKKDGRYKSMKNEVANIHYDIFSMKSGSYNNHNNNINIQWPMNSGSKYFGDDSEFRVDNFLMCLYRQGIYSKGSCYEGVFCRPETKQINKNLKLRQVTYGIYLDTIENNFKAHKENNWKGFGKDNNQVRSYLNLCEDLIDEDSVYKEVFCNKLREIAGINQLYRSR